MNVSLYKVHFVGGPSDGWVLCGPDFSVRTKIQMPASPATVRCGQPQCYELVGYWATAYLLTSLHRTVEDGHPTTCLRYDFLGYELLETQANLASSQPSVPRWLIDLGKWLAQVPRGFSKWLLEPIDYPLKVSAKETASSQRAEGLSRISGSIGSEMLGRSS